MESTINFASEWVCFGFSIKLKKTAIFSEAFHLKLECDCSFDVVFTLPYHPHKQPSKYCREFLVHHFSKEYTMTYHVKGLGHVHCTSKNFGPISNKVADTLDYHLGAHSCRAVILIAELKIVKAKRFFK